MSSKSDWEKTAKAITSEEWSLRIKCLTNRHERVKAACIVWWDFFGDAKGRWSGIGSILRSWKSETDIDQERLAEVLVAIGYPADAAQKRACSAKRLVLKQEEMPEWDAEEPCMERDNSHRYPGAKSALFAICEQSIEDVKTLIEHGVIVDGKVAAGWPTPNSYGVAGYTGRSEVADLIEFVADGQMQKFASQIGLDLQMQQVLVAIGLHKKVKVA